MIKSECLFNPIEESDGTRIAVLGSVPPGISFDEAYSELAPSKELLYNYKYHGLSWKDYEVRFFQLMKGHRAQRRKVKQVQKRDYL
jgi:uncharacterized protein YeaO (DUF488 family)